LELLSEDYRRVLILRHREERPFEETGKAVRKLGARAVARLQEEWEKPSRVGLGALGPERSLHVYLCLFRRRKPAGRLGAPIALFLAQILQKQPLRNVPEAVGYEVIEPDDRADACSLPVRGSLPCHISWRS